MRAFVFAVSSVFAAAWLAAAPALAGEKISESRQAAAAKLLEIMDPEKSMLGGASAMTDAMIAQNAALTPYRDVIMDWASKYLTWEALGPGMTALYAEAYSESELKDLIRFYQTPTGQKTVRMMPELAAKGAMLGQKVAEQHVAELDAALRARASELQEAGQAP